MSTRNNILTNGTQPKLSTWIFQANPSRYRIEDSLRVESEEFWNLNQHATKIHAGDRVLVWISGKEAGIYAVGTVMTEPVKRSDSVKGLSYWHKRKDGLNAKPRVLVRYDRIIQNSPLLRVFIRCDPALWNLSIIRCAIGTNFPVREEEWLAIKNWLDSAQK